MTKGVDLPKKAFVTGITGQDGSYLAELLLAKGYSTPVASIISTRIPTTRMPACSCTTAT